MRRRLAAGASSFSWALVIASLLARPTAAQEGRADPLREWAVDRGFALSIDTQGYRYPTSIAVVPHPGPGPKDPLYFVTELHGRLAVVTNDRSVYTFAEGFFHLEPVGHPKRDEYLPELGMAGICLDAQHGYVFVSFTYQTPKGAILNNVVRFETKPQTFTITPTASLAFTEIFSDQIGDLSHMIGPMVVDGDTLFVQVGDAHAARLTRDTSSTAGKILRMTLDGRPLADNPFYVDGSVKNAANFVWAKGLRNPFGVAIVNGRYFITDVGPNVDRFLEITRGGDYGYDGTDWSISSHAAVVFAPSAAPVQLVYHPEDAGPLPAPWRGMFYLVASGDQLNVGPSEYGKKSLIRIKYDFEHNQVVDRPFEIVKYVGSGTMMPVGLGLGPDGLYVVVFDPQSNGTTYVMKVRYDPEHEHPIHVDQADALMEKFACLGCHLRDGKSPGPPLEPELLVPRLLRRLNSAEYEAESKRLDRLEEEPFRSFRSARQSIREANGLEKVRLWIKNRIMEPRFDMPKAVMPRLGLGESDAASIAAKLASSEGADEPFAGAKRWLAALVPKPRQRHLLLSFAIGCGFGSAATAVVAVVVGWARRRRK